MITTDRGAHFESTLFQTLLNLLGCTHIRTTAYHPAANGMVERFRRQLKTALRAAEDPENWADNVHVALLDIRAALKSDLDCSAAELVFGTTLRLPGEMVTPTSRGAEETPCIWDVSKIGISTPHQFSRAKVELHEAILFVDVTLFFAPISPDLVYKAMRKAEETQPWKYELTFQVHIRDSIRSWRMMQSLCMLSLPARRPVYCDGLSFVGLRSQHSNLTHARSPARDCSDPEALL
nr:unnamed protein product [Spirometra erinaceieuropaei]